MPGSRSAIVVHNRTCCAYSPPPDELEAVDGMEYAAAGALAIPLVRGGTAVGLGSTAAGISLAEMGFYATGGLAVMGLEYYVGQALWAGVIKGHVDGEGGFVLDDGTELSEQGEIGTWGESGQGIDREFWRWLQEVRGMWEPGMEVEYGPTTPGPHLPYLPWPNGLGPAEPTDASQGEGARSDTVTKASGLEIDVHGNIVDPNVVDTQTGERWDGGTIKKAKDRGVTAEKLGELAREVGRPPEIRGPWKPPVKGSSWIFGVPELLEEGENGGLEIVGYDEDGNAIVLIEDEDGNAHYFVFYEDGSFAEVNEDGTALGSEGEDSTGTGSAGASGAGGIQSFDTNVYNPDKDFDGQSDAIEEARQDLEENFSGMAFMNAVWDAQVADWKNTQIEMALEAGQKTTEAIKRSRQGDPGLGMSFGGTLNEHGGYSALGSAGSGEGSSVTFTTGDANDGGTGTSEGPGPTAGVVTMGEGTIESALGIGLNEPGYLGHEVANDYDNQGGFSSSSHTEYTYLPGAYQCDDGCVCHCSYQPNYGLCPDHGDDEMPGTTWEWTSEDSYNVVCNGCGCVSSSVRIMGG